MINTLPQDTVIRPDTANPNKAVEYIKSYIKNTNCPFLSVDISHINIFDACYISTLCSAEHYLKYSDGKIEWKISSDSIREFNKEFELGNSDYSL